MKRWIIMLFVSISILCFATFTVSGKASESECGYMTPTQLNIGESITLDNSKGYYTFIVSNDEVLEYISSTSTLYAKGNGEAVVYKYTKRNSKLVSKILVQVGDAVNSISISGKDQLAEGDSYQFTASCRSGCSVTFSSSDEDILTVSSDGLVTAKSVGMARVIATDTKDTSVFSEAYVVVTSKDGIITKDEIVNIDSSDYDQVFSLLAKHTAQAMMGVYTYFKVLSKYSAYDNGCGFVYKRIAHLNNGLEVEEGYDFADVEYFDYYLVTNKHLVTKTSYNQYSMKTTQKDVDKISLYYGNEKEYDASIVAYDSKYDVAVLNFKSTMYFPTVTLADSSEVKAGQFILSIGTGLGKEYFGTVSFGIVSAPLRYISDDTDGDGTNDWDAAYLQHDAAINSSDCGSPVINLKGEVVGINTTKKISSNSGLKVENLSFAIPASILDQLLPSLEAGKVPERPKIGVTVFSLVDIYPNIELYRQYYGYNIPTGYDKGFFVTEITAGGIADLAGVKTDDLILKFNDVDLVYMYQLRQELDHYIVGSGQTATLTILRNGEIITITLVF